MSFLGSSSNPKNKMADSFLDDDAAAADAADAGTGGASIRSNDVESRGGNDDVSSPPRDDDDETDANKSTAVQQQSKKKGNIGSASKVALQEKFRSLTFKRESSSKLGDDDDSDDSQEMDIEGLLIGKLGPLALPNFIHASAWNEVRRILDASTVSEEAMDMILHAKDGDGDNVLNVALYKRAPTDILHKLISLGGPALIQEQNSSNQTSLHYACTYQANVDVVSKLIDIGGDNLVSQRDEEELTPLHNACLRNDGSKAVVKLLIEKGGQDLITATDEDGFTALHYACRGNAAYDIVQLLIDHGAENLVFMSTNQGWTALHHACANDATVDVIELLVHVGKKRLVLQNTNETDDEPERNALDLACMYHDDPAVIETVLTCAGDNLFESNWHEVTTSLFLLCARGAPANMITPFLLRGGKEILAERRANNISVLHAACNTDDARLETIETLLNIGGRALLFAEDASGRKAIHYAMEHDIDVDIFKVLLKKGRYELAISRNRHQNNALHMICSNTPLEAINLIAAYSRGITCFQKDADGDTPLDCLIQHNSDFAPKHIHLLQDIMYGYDRAGSTISDHTLAAVRDTPDEKRELIIRGKYIRSAMNHLAVTPFALWVIFSDVIMQIVILWIYSFDIDQNRNNNSGSPNGFNLSVVSRTLLCLSFGWGIIREGTQLYYSNFWDYIGDPSNMIDTLQIGLVSFTITTFHATFQQDTLLFLLICCIGISWLRLVFIFGNIIYKIKVFNFALVSITRKLVPFIFVTVIVTISFAHMYYATGPPPSIQCPNGSESKLTDYEYIEGGWACKLSDAYFKSFTMLFNGDFAYLDKGSGVSSTLSMIFAGVIGIVLLNILIAVVNDSFVKVEGDSEKAFWLGRFLFVNELTDFKNFFKSLFPCWKKSESEQKQNELDALKMIASNNASLHGKPSRHKFSCWDDRNAGEWKHYQNCYNLLDWYDGGDSDKPSFYIRLFAFFKVAQWSEILPPSQGFRKVIAGVQRNENIDSLIPGISAWGFSLLIFVAICALTPIIFFLGLVSCGVLWPMEFKEAIFFGPLETKQVQVQKNDIIDIERKMSSKMEKIRMEFKTAMERSVTDQKEILALLRVVADVTINSCSKH